MSSICDFKIIVVKYLVNTYNFNLKVKDDIIFSLFCQNINSIKEKSYFPNIIQDVQEDRLGTRDPNSKQSLNVKNDLNNLDNIV